MNRREVSRIAITAFAGVILGVLIAQPWIGYPLVRWAEPVIVPAFGIIYYDGWNDTIGNTKWMGVPLQKYPTDLWAYQEILYETRPDLIVEAGTFKGGSALYFANMCDLLGSGHVITMDILDQTGKPKHPRIEYQLLSSTSGEAEEVVRARAKAGGKVMAVLDSNHTKEHVLKELQIYSKYVTKGCYLVVEDTNINGHPVRSSYGPGPMEALEEFLQRNKDFEVDRTRERFKLTSHPKGYLRRVTERPPI